MKLHPLLALGLFACGGSTPEASPMDGIRQTLVEDFVDYTLLPAYSDFADSTENLAEQTRLLAADPTPARRMNAQAAWREAMHDWQIVEPMSVGPAAAATQRGGEDRRDNIYSWPLSNPCAVDAVTLEPASADIALLADELVNVRGLDALERLLFAEGTNACPADHVVNTDGRWNEAQITERRAVYAGATAALLTTHATDLRTRWDAFRTQIVATPSSAFRDPLEAVSAISDAMFYLDTVMKDLKIGAPAGLFECDTDVCPDSRESLYASVSIPHIRANLEGFARVFRGAEGRTGFEELLQAAGAASVASEMNAAIDEALAQAAAVDGELAILLAANPRVLMPLYDAVKAVTDILKSPAFLMPVSLRVPREAAGDSD